MDFGAKSFSVLLTAVLLLLSLSQQQPPHAVGRSAPVTEFSSGRAMQHVTTIARQPHPMGSAAHSEVRDYILAQLRGSGLNPEVQKATVISPRGGASNLARYSVGFVQNIVVRIKGTNSSNAVLVVGHYDSVPASPGANDNGSGVAAMLEVSQILKAGPPLKNDVILLFSDGEEMGLLGAKAFVDEHPWARDIRIVINLDVRGHTGPSIMFETSPQNGWLVEEYARVAPLPIASSLMYELYRLLPYDTDLTVFKKAGYTGLNLAYIAGSTHYHNPLDNSQNVDERSLQHQGSSALALTKHFGNLDLNNTKRKDAVYFNVFGTVINYSETWRWPIIVVVLVIFTATLLVGFKKAEFTISGVALGGGALLVCLILNQLIVTVLSLVVRALDRGYQWSDYSYSGDLYKVSLTVLTIALTLSVYQLLHRKVSLGNLMFGGLFWWLALMVLAGAFMPGASYLFTWPLLFILLGLGLYLGLKEKVAPAHLQAAIVLFTIPGIVLIVQLVGVSMTGLPLTFIGLVATLTTLSVVFLIPYIDLIARPYRWFLPSLLLLTSVALSIFGIATSGFTKDHPKPNAVFYASNADTGVAVWASPDSKPDEWTSRFLSATPDKGKAPEFYPLSPRAFLKNSAPFVSLPAPDVTLLEDTVSEGFRVLRMRITSPRQAPSVSAYVEASGEISSAEIDGKKINSTESGILVRSLPKSTAAANSRLEFFFSAFPIEGVELTLVTNSTPLKIRLVDQSYQFPELPGFTVPVRPDNMMKSSFSLADSTLVSKAFSF
jgi:hypothetical protein